MKIAVVGGGISGLGSALILSQKHEVHLFESEPRLGGHAHTVQVAEGPAKIPIDTGFLVYNELTYPHLTAFFDYLKVPTVASEMSLAVRMEHKNLEWCGTDLNGVFAQRSNLLRPSFIKMLLDILRFNREAEKNLAAARAGQWSLARLLRERNFSNEFVAGYLLPMGAAIWSTPEQGMLDFPAETFLTFCLNHRLLQVHNRPVWRTVRGGSMEYVNRVRAKLQHVHLGHKVVRVERVASGVRVQTEVADQLFDIVVMATHAPVTKKILVVSGAKEESILRSFRVQPNRAVLHTDVSLMPKRKSIWSSWNVFASADREKSVFLSYYINKLQPLLTKNDYFVSLNPNREAAHPILKLDYDHPQFDQLAIAGQQELAAVQGQGGVYFAGAWTRYGFHEDGLLSAVNVARLIGVDPPWRIA